MTGAAALGGTRSQLQQAIDVAHNVQTNAVGIHLRAAQRILDEVVPAPTAVPADLREKQGACGCGENGGTQDLIADAQGAAPPESVPHRGSPAARRRSEVYI
jgi:hypothetical protein